MGRDFENIFAHPSWASVLGWLVRTAALFAIGGLTVIFLKRNLKSISMIFLTGVVAPGIVRALVSQDGAAVFTSPPVVTEAKDAAAAEEASKPKGTAAPAPAAIPAAPPPPPPVQAHPSPGPRPVKPKPQPVSKIKSPMKSFLVALRG
jgi:hypothetical protein